MANNNLEDILKEITPPLKSYVRSRVRNHNDADDIVQDTLYQFLRTVSIMDNPVGKLSSWLYTVAHNLIINHGKKKHEEKMPYSDNEDNDTFMTDLSEIMMTSDNESPDIQMLRTMVWEELERALSELPEEQREAVVMTEIKGLSIKEAAELMGVAQNTFLSRKHYAVLYLRKRLQGLYEELVLNK